jgi:2-polyprenyl-3-methyl-5-hydroxy-6-metoxy-1,4-benzoquinol methylase
MADSAHPGCSRGTPDESLVEVVRSGVVTAGRTLEVGCGTGTNALWLAEQGFAVLGVDVAPLAIERARAKQVSPHYFFDAPSAWAFDV